ncbi:MAG: 2-C-methyl-D-erythritol 4-phosphate cytidylyltransferase [Syntrophomonadaceae bacterium]|nr:2-C-methyl-D-erythritol 4-phosphate cytidylyltransferase [Syntrophomonadaceae bacterium]
MGTVGVIIAAAGQGTRMGTPVNKQFLLLDGRPVLMHSWHTFSSLSEVVKLVVVAHPQEVETCRRLLPDDGRTLVVSGGRERQDSVMAGLACLQPAPDLVAVHDGARPLVTTGLIRRVIEAAARCGAAVPGVPVVDTLKMVNAEGFVEATLERSRVQAIQTPQVFRWQPLVDAYARAQRDGFRGTDDASIYERYAGPVRVVAGARDNIKITVPEDVLLANLLLQARAGGCGTLVPEPALPADEEAGVTRR